MATLLTISQNIAKEAKSSVVPSTIINNSEEVAKQIFSSIRKANIDMYERFDWQVLQKQHDFNTVASTYQYSLPSDFGRIVNDTFINSTSQDDVLLVDAKEWRELKLTSNTSVKDRYRIRANQIEITPTPSAVESMVFDYIINTSILDTDGSTKKTGWVADTDSPLINSDLIELQATWRFLKLRGKDYAEEKVEAEERFATLVGRDGGRRTISHSRRIRSIYPETISGV